MIKRKNLIGWSLIGGAVVLLAVSEFVPNMLIGLLTSIAAMLVGGIGIYIVFDDTKQGS